jgi:AcrR family transcriptional regulator
MGLRAERGEITRQHLLNTAIRLFAEQGYEQVTIEAVLRETGSSRGSLYYHFAGKEVLFSAALEATEARIAAAILAAAQGMTDPLEALRVGCNAWLDLAATDDAVKRIVLIDAPGVVGWEKWREIDARYGFGILKGALEVLAQGGMLPVSSVDLFAHTLLAVLCEIALVIARSTDPASIAAARDVFATVFNRLFVSTV